MTIATITLSKTIDEHTGRLQSHIWVSIDKWPATEVFQAQFRYDGCIYRFVTSGKDKVYIVHPETGKKLDIGTHEARIDLDSWVKLSEKSY